MKWFASVQSKMVFWQGVRCFFGSNKEDGVSGWEVGFVWIGWRYVSF
jgi:hypothetical protein